MAWFLASVSCPRSLLILSRLLSLLVQLLELLLVILFSRLNYRPMASILILGSNVLVQLAHRSLIFSVGSRGTSANKPLRLLTMLFLGSRSHLISLSLSLSLSLSHTHTLARTHAHTLPHFQHRWDLHKNSVSERSLFTQRTSERKRTNIDRRYTIAIPTYCVDIDIDIDTGYLKSAYSSIKLFLMDLKLIHWGYISSCTTPGI